MTKTETPTQTLRVSQIAVNLVLLNEHDAPVSPEQIVFAGNENGTAIDNLMAWVAALPLQLGIAAAQVEAPEKNGKP